MLTGPVVLTEDEKEQLRELARQGIILTDTGATPEFQHELDELAGPVS
jgi:hypothetical protein